MRIMSASIGALSLLLAPGEAPAQEADPFAPYADLVAACYDDPEGSARPGCRGLASDACMHEVEAGMSTHGMTRCLLAERDGWDALLNREYAHALDFAGAMDDSDRDHFPEFADRTGQLRAAQRAWIAWRDANCGMWEGLWGSGSMRLIFAADCLLTMTAERTLELREYRTTMQ